MRRIPAENIETWGGRCRVGNEQREKVEGVDTAFLGHVLISLTSPACLVDGMVPLPEGDTKRKPVV